VWCHRKGAWCRGTVWAGAGRSDLQVAKDWQTASFFGLHAAVKASLLVQLILALASDLGFR
jgi:hypothetical protein